MEKQKNNINLEEFILKQLDWSLEMKARIENKSTGYLAITSFLIGIMFQIVTSDKFDNLTQMNVFRVFSKATISVGVIVIIACGIILYPKDIGFFKVNWLMKLYNEIKELKNSDTVDRDERMLEKAKTYIDSNMKSICFMSFFSKIVSVATIAMLLLFLGCLIFIFKTFR